MNITHHLLSKGHDSSISVVYPGGAVINIKTASLPLITLTWTTEDSIVAGGHDCQPYVFSGNESGWELIGSLDDPNANKQAGGARAGLGGSSPVGRLNSAAFNTFRNADSRGISNLPGSPTASNATESEIFTVHQNTIAEIRAYEGVPGAVSRVSTSGVDGKLVIWDTSSVTPVGTSVGGVTAKMGGMRFR